MSWDLYPEEMIDKASSLPVTQIPEVGVFHNFAEGAGKVAMKIAAETARAGQMAGAVVPIYQDRMTDRRLEQATGSPPFNKTVTAQQRYFKAMEEGPLQSAVDYWTPRPNEVGVAGEVTGSLLAMLPLIMAGPAGPSIAVGATQLTQGQNLVKEGVDPGKAQAVGAVQAIGLGAGIWMPILGTNALQRIVIGGAGFNVVQGVATRAASKAILEGDKAAEQFRPLGGTELTLDILLGLAFGTMAHINPAQRAQGAKAWEDIGNFLKDSPPSDKAALATLREAQHINLDSLPGTPQTAADLDVHVQRMRAAIESLATDKPVDVENIVKDTTTPETVGDQGSPAVKDSLTVDQLPDAGNMVDVQTSNQPRYNPDLARIEQDQAIREAIQEHAKTVAAEEGIPQIPDRKTIAQTIEEQLVQAGRPAEEAKAGATLWQAFFDTTASRYGRTGQDLFDRYMKGITGQAGEGPMLAQPDKLFQGAVPWYHSELERQIGTAKMGAASPKDWKNFIKGLSNKGVKADEVKWTGLEEWLDLQQGKVTKEQIQQYMKDGGVKVEETMLGATAEGFAVRRNPSRGGWDARGTDGNWWGGYATEQEALRAAHGGDPTKFASYQLPGGENYRELLLTLPTKEPVVDNLPPGWTVEQMANGRSWTLVGPSGVGTVLNTLPSGASREMALVHARDRLQRDNKLPEKPSTFQSSHFDQPNILAHIRFNERTDADGKKVLFIEEIQSDWAQKGKKEGFANTEPELPKDWNVRRATEDDAATFDVEQGRWVLFDDSDDLIAMLGAKGMTEAEAKTAAINVARDSGVDLGHFGGKNAGVPSAPFVGKTEAWVGLSLKRMIRYAAENGFDRVAWTNGEQQAARYDLSKQIDGVSSIKMEDGKFRINALKDGNQIISRIVPAEGVAELVGKDLAEKIVNEQGGDVDQFTGMRFHSGLDLKVGGEGMKAFYDRIVPNVANDVLKKLGGGRVGEVTIDVQGKGLSEVREYIGPEVSADKVREIAKDDNAPAAIQRQLGEIADAIEAGKTTAEAVQGYGSIAAANAIGGELRGKASVEAAQPGFDITPSMREKAMETQALFQPERGALQFDQQGKMAIALLKSADPSTFLHESGHFFLEVTNDLASQPDAPAAMKQDMQTLYSWFGLKDADTWNNMTLDEKRPYHEQFARGFERYLRDGQAPTPVLKGLFQRFRDWLKAVYQSASQLNVEVSDQVRAVMDRMLAEPQRTEAPPEATRSATPPPPRGGVGEPMGEASVPEGTVKPFEPKTADDPQILEMLRDMATNEAGWAQVGGKWMGKAEKGSGVPNFTTWIPKAEWWNDRPDKKMNEAKFVEAVTKHMTDEKMSPAERRAIEFLTDIANKRLEAKQLYDDAEWNRIAQEVATEGMDPTTKNVVDADAVSIAMQIDEARVERAAITAADDFDFMAEVREIIDGYKPQQDATAAERGTPTAAKPGTPGPAGQEANAPGADRNAGNQGVIAQQAMRMVAENPDLPIATGVDAQGNTTYQKASEYLAEAKAMADLKRQDVSLFELAAQCLLGGGR